MSLEKILTPVTILQFLEIKIDDFKIILDDVISLQINYDIDSLKILGSIKFKDSFDMTSSGLVKLNNNNKLTVSMKDNGETKSYRTYRLTKADAVNINDRFKVYDCTFQDEISFILENTYQSQSFTSTVASKVKEALSTASIKSVIASDKLNVVVNDTGETRTLTIPQNQNLLDFYSYQLRKDNIRIYQDRNTIYITEIKPSSIVALKDPLDGTNLTFTNDCAKNTYLFKIHDYQDFKNPTSQMNKLAPVVVISSSTSPKSISQVTISLPEFFNDLKLNDMALGGIQLTSGTRTETSEELAIGWQKAKLFDVFIRNQQMFIVVPGTLKYSNIGTVVNTLFKGGIGANDTALEGDTMTSGKYFVLGVSDRFLGDKLIQRLHLGRLDGKKSREKK